MGRGAEQQPGSGARPRYSPLYGVHPVRPAQAAPTVTATKAVVGEVEGSPIVVVYVGEYWLAHVRDTDWDHATGPTPRQAVEKLMAKVVPSFMDHKIIWGDIDRLRAPDKSS